MLHVEEDEVAARHFEDVPDSRRRELHYEVAELELPAPALGFQCVRHSRALRTAAPAVLGPIVHDGEKPSSLAVPRARSLRKVRFPRLCDNSALAKLPPARS